MSECGNRYLLESLTYVLSNSLEIEASDPKETEVSRRDKYVLEGDVGGGKILR